MDQALPTQFPDLGNLPMVAASQVGQQQRIAGQNNQSLQDAFRAAQEHEAQMRPLTIQGKQADIRNTNATADMHGEQTRGFRIGNDTKAATQAGDIAAANSKNKIQMSEDELKQTEAFGTRMQQAAVQLKNIPPMFRAQAAKKLLGKDFADNPEFEQFLGQHADQLPSYLEKLGAGIFNNTKMAREESLKHKREIDKITLQGSNQRQLEQMGIDAGKYKRTGGSGSKTKTFEDTLIKETSPFKRYNLLTEAAMMALQEGDPEAAQGYSQRAMSIKAAAEQEIAAKGAGNQVVNMPQGGGKPTLAPKGGAGPGLPVPATALPQPGNPAPAAPQGGAPVQVKSLQERDALPPGTLYMDPQGNIRRKK
jgi:hypothetical protein